MGSFPFFLPTGEDVLIYYQVSFFGKLMYDNLSVEREFGVKVKVDI